MSLRKIEHTFLEPGVARQAVAQSMTAKSTSPESEQAPRPELAAQLFRAADPSPVDAKSTASGTVLHYTVKLSV